MKLFTTKQQRHEALLKEESQYEAAAQEVAFGQIRPGLFAKALEISQGNEFKARGVYLKLRVNLRQAEIAAGREIQEAMMSAQLREDQARQRDEFVESAKSARQRQIEWDRYVDRHWKESWKSVPIDWKQLTSLGLILNAFLLIVIATNLTGIAAIAVTGASISSAILGVWSFDVKKIPRELYDRLTK